MYRIIDSSCEYFEAEWYNALNKSDLSTPMYSLIVREFDKEILSERLIEDYSFILMNQSEAVALVPLYFMGDMKIFSYGNEYLRSPLLVNCEAISKKKKKKIESFVFTYINQLAIKKSAKSHWVMSESIRILSGDLFYNYFQDYGYEDKSTISQVIDLRLSEAELFANIRKSYRSLINQAKRKQVVEVLNFENYKINKFKEYELLHQKAAGRKTRNQESFRKISQMIMRGNAILTTVNNFGNITQAAYIFFIQNQNALYASSAMDKDIMDSDGSGHLAMWASILYLKNMGCKYLDLGQLRVGEASTKKENDIALYKRGFGGETVITFRGRKMFPATSK